MLQVEVIEPAVKGTLNVLKASVEVKIKRFVFVSSGAAVGLNPSWPKDRVMDETCWSDKEYCRTTKVAPVEFTSTSNSDELLVILYFSIADNFEITGIVFPKRKLKVRLWSLEKESGLDVVSVCPTLILGPLLQSTLNSSSLVLVKLLKEGYETVENKLRMIVDVRDVAEALLLAYEKPEAEGRYICTAYIIRAQEFVDKVKSIYPNYKYPKNFTQPGEERVLTSEKLQKLGWSYRPLEETFVDSVESYQKAGILN
ncbi:hypothetical protein Pint_09172 [Pistacia integerrima]|uniref:Uncharacterized protein n=1 Tax=Pistacia integerrima TaxID=434235 RepID=A0ACC0XVD2_9ROSI|nr:hypothetical protein Pint_09172 [Pistacia integerrima]